MHILGASLVFGGGLLFASIDTRISYLLAGSGYSGESLRTRRARLAFLVFSGKSQIVTVLPFFLKWCQILGLRSNPE